MLSIGRTLPEYQGNESWTLPIPAAFVVGQDGRIKARFADPDYRRRAAVEELIAALQSRVTRACSTIWLRAASS